LMGVARSEGTKLIEVAGEFSYDGAKSYSHYDIYKRLGKWLKEMNSKLGKVMRTPGSKNYLQPYVSADNESFVKEIRKQTDYGLTPKNPDTSFEPRMNQIKALLSQDGLLIHKDCERLLEEIENTKWGEENNLVLPALANALVYTDRWILQPGKKPDEFTNQDLLESFSRQG